MSAEDYFPNCGPWDGDYYDCCDVDDCDEYIIIEDAVIITQTDKAILIEISDTKTSNKKLQTWLAKSVIEIFDNNDHEVFFDDVEINNQYAIMVPNWFNIKWKPIHTQFRKTK